jgi:peptidoglycan/LPS O-acetylase OafA/YrhL
MLEVCPRKKVCSPGASSRSSAVSKPNVQPSSLPREGPHVTPTTSEGVSASTRLRSIDTLRGVAIFAVLIAHLPFSWSTGPGGVPVSVLPDWLMSITSRGGLGVDLFIVISGFCIHQAMSHAPRGERPRFFQFWKRRLLRLYPPYLGALLITLVGLVYYNGVVGSARGFPGILGYQDGNQARLDLILLLGMAQNFNGASERIGNGPFWSLALEEQLYLLYFGLLALLRRFSWPLVLLTTFCVSIGWRVFGYANAGAVPTGWQVLGPGRWFEWTLGALAVEAFAGRIVLPAWCRSPAVTLTALAAGIAAPTLATMAPGRVAWIPTALETSIIGFACFNLVNCCVQAEKTTALFSARALLPLHALGKVSYSVYLIHSVAIVPAKLIALKLGGGVAAILLARLAAGIGAGVLYHRLVERRFTRLSKRTRQERTLVKEHDDLTVPRPSPS